MACTSPLVGLRYFDESSGKFAVEVLSGLNSYSPDDLQKCSFSQKGELISIPCGQCLACRLQRSSEWASRIALEALETQNNYFITLTYDDEHVPHAIDRDTGEYFDNLSLCPDDLQKFMKRLRIQAERQNFVEFTDYDGKKLGIRFYASGEYGKLTHRPHYHIIVFGLKIPDLKFSCMSKSNVPTFSSDWLQNKIWKKGIVNIGYVSVASAGYVARYCVDKLNGDAAKFYEEFHLIPEFSRMSLRPGIGRRFFDRHSDQIVSEGKINVADSAGGHQRPIPKYFMRLAEISHPLEFDDLKERRAYRAKENQKIQNIKCALTYEEQLALQKRLIQNRALRLVRALD